MKVLLHVCCGPCTLYPLYRLKEAQHDVTGFFFNPNIHPFKEFQRRLETLKDFSQMSTFPVIYEEEYGFEHFIRKIVFHEQQRCTLCYSMRLEATVSKAKALGFEAFTTTLLYSKYQKHSQLKEFCENLSIKHEIDFIYEDFREGWNIGIENSKKIGMYRQPYCGCIYSEQERYDKSLRKKSSR